MIIIILNETKIFIIDLRYLHIITYQILNFFLSTKFAIEYVYILIFFSNLFKLCAKEKN